MPSERDDQCDWERRAPRSNCTLLVRMCTVTGPAPLVPCTGAACILIAHQGRFNHPHQRGGRVLRVGPRHDPSLRHRRTPAIDRRFAVGAAATGDVRLHPRLSRHTSSTSGRTAVQPTSRSRGLGPTRPLPLHVQSRRASFPVPRGFHVLRDLRHTPPRSTDLAFVDALWRYIADGHPLHSRIRRRGRDLRRLHVQLDTSRATCWRAARTRWDD